MSNLKNACHEYQTLSRRSFLGASTAAGIAVTVPAWLPRVALASSYGSGRDVLISIYLRGGVDGLTMCVPHGDNDYYNLRPTINVPRPDSSAPRKAIDLDGFFGFAPAMQPLLDAYQDQKLAIVHACGVNGWSRSHFDAQRWMETGAHFSSASSSGWLARHIAATPPLSPSAVIRALSMTYGMSATLNGAPASVAVPDPRYYDLQGDWSNLSELKTKLDEMYAAESDPLRQSAIDTQATISLLDTIDFENYIPAGGAVYPDTDFGRAMKSAAALIKADVGVEAVHIDKDNWDTHANQGSVDGDMDQLMVDLAATMNAFYVDMFASNRQDWTMMALSEFGRTAQENNSAGTDHGTATAVMVMGGAVQGGRVIRNWPGLAAGQLYDGVDLAPTTDYRNVVCEVLSKRGGNTNLQAVYPGFTPTFPGIFL